MSKRKGITRREFLKKSTVETVAAAGLATTVTAEPLSLLAAPPVDRVEITAAMGDTLIPTADGYPGYKRLEQYGISKEVVSKLPVSDAELDSFNSASAALFGGKTFLQMDEKQRAEYLNLIIAGQKVPDKKLLDTLQKVYRAYRTRVFTVFYQNFPEHQVKRDAQGVPLLPPGDEHQIINPNTRDLVTGWDIANFRGPLSWDEEEARRARFRKIHWHEG